MKSRHHFIWLAVVLMIAWLILRIALAVTSLALHLLWIGAIICGVIWILRQISGKDAA